MGRPGSPTLTETALGDDVVGLGDATALAPSGPYLVVFEATRTRVFVLPERGEVVIGRGDDAALRVDDRRASRAHLRIAVNDDGITATDLGSHNGTRLNGRRLTADTPLCSGDVLEIGSTALALHAPRRSAAATDGPGPAPEYLNLGDASVVVADPAMLRAYVLLERLAASELPVLIYGETGTGKELAARAVHHFSPRRERPLLTLNCAAFAESLVESELFGHERGAFTGATQQKPGLLEAASGGTLILDEIAELPQPTQAKLLRALGSKKVLRLGDVRERDIDVRIVACTHRALEHEVRAGRFRRDLYFRLNGACVWLPPLRHRPAELRLLAHSLLSRACERLSRPGKTLSPGALEVLGEHEFPGNVRELEHLMEFCAAAYDDDLIEPWHLSDRLSAAVGPEATELADEAKRPPLAEELRGLERQRMVDALEQTGGNKKRAAELLGMPLRTFTHKLGQYGLVSRSGRGT
ncbi:MAG: sigma 54-interacting transcriptional regulator [Polyangiaceae bacterium]|nr:sigma 54-interacting transcriptional regulator [Polyangiaceae bacterium]